MVMSNCDFKKARLSASTDGRGVKISATASPGSLIHTAMASLAAYEWDEIWLRVVNTASSAVKLTLEWGDTNAPDDQIELTIPGEQGLVEVVKGHLLHNGLTVRAFADTANVLVVHGYVNRFEQNP